MNKKLALKTINKIDKILVRVENKKEEETNHWYQKWKTVYH